MIHAITSKIDGNAFCFAFAGMVVLQRNVRDGS